MKKGVLVCLVFLLAAFFGQRGNSVAQTTTKQRPGVTRPSTAKGMSSTLPDLVITDDTIAQNEWTATALAKLHNRGITAASFQTGQVLAKVVAGGKTYVIKAPGGGVYLAPGGDFGLSQQLSDPVSGTYAVTWTANPDRVVAESNYTNNEKAGNVDVHNTLPDLVVSKIAVNPPSGSINTLFEFAVTVTNQGFASTNNCQAQMCWFRIDGQAGGDYDVRWGPCTVLQPGASVVHKVRMNKPFPKGNHTIAATVDSGNVVTELREDNNGASAGFSVTDTATVDRLSTLAPPDIPRANTPGPPNSAKVNLLPDLVISQLSVNPTSGAPGTVFEFTIVVTNKGGAVAPAGLSQLCRLSLDGYRLQDAEYQWAGYTNLDPGASVVHKVRLKRALALGQHTLKAVVDDAWELNEQNEYNNDATVTFTVK